MPQSNSSFFPPSISRIFARHTLRRSPIELFRIELCFRPPPGGLESRLPGYAVCSGAHLPLDPLLSRGNALVSLSRRLSQSLPQSPRGCPRDGRRIHGESTLPNLAQVERSFSPWFRLRSCTGIGVTVPPSYLEPMVRKFPRLLGILSSIDKRISRLPLLRVMGDHMLLHFEREAQCC